jgi:hypothetical protein
VAADPTVGGHPLLFRGWRIVGALAVIQTDLPASTR